MRITDVSIEFVLTDKDGQVIADPDVPTDDNGGLVFGSYEQAVYERRIYMQKEGIVHERDVQVHMNLNGRIDMGTVCLP